MESIPRQPDPTPDPRTPFQKFDALARRVFTAPKSAADKPAPKLPAKEKPEKRKR